MKEDLTVWNMVHKWCDGLRADIPDMAKRCLMDEIESHDREVAVEFLLASISAEPITDKEIGEFYYNVYDEWKQLIN